jgi:hypothetical protein
MSKLKEIMDSFERLENRFDSLQARNTKRDAAERLSKEHRAELYNLYHLARTALDNPSDYNRRVYATNEFGKIHPNISKSMVYLEFEKSTV